MDGVAQDLGLGMILGGVALATLVVLGYLVFIWWLDRYEREPAWVMAGAFSWGALVGTSMGCLISLPFAVGALFMFGEGVGTMLGAVVVAPVVEEATKASVFALLLLTRHIDNETDGLLYGAATGLGFAAMENLLYFAGAADEGAEAFVTVVVMRTFFTALVHCISSAMVGMAIGHARHRSGALRWVVWPAVGYGLAVVHHGLWNLAASLSAVFEGAGAVVMGLAMLMVAGLSVAMFALTQWSLWREHAVIKRILEQEAGRGVLPHAHAAIIPYWTKRARGGWLPPDVPRAAYVRAATLLAFRHHQMELAKGERRALYEGEIAQYRQEIGRYLRSA